MSLPLHLRRRAFAGAASAYFLPELDAGRLFQLCARHELDPTGRLFHVQGGVLLTLVRPSSQPPPGVVRLRTLAPNVFLPVDATLLPALLDDELAALGRDRGLVFLPWGPVLGFDPHAPLDPEDLIVANPVAEGRWRPFPQGLRVAEKIEEIELVVPEESPDSLFEAEGESIGTEPPVGDESTASPNVFDGTADRLRRAMTWLGSLLRLKKRDQHGAGSAAGTVGNAARLTEQAMKRQAAALLSLLREFREGDVNQALRRALPLGGSGGDRGARVDTGDQLPSRDFSYSLGNLFDQSSRKPATLWLGGRDVLEELGREYHKAAEQAQRNGDYRRAALIYGKLLRDYRMAAHCLMRGGLHHDAAVLLLNRLDDPRAAASAFEAAGEVDLAVRLYRRAGAHVEAGDLLRRMGEDEAALLEYRLAADRLVGSGEGHLAAGRLLLEKAGRADLALEQFRKGWDLRPRGNALSCLRRALSLHAELASTHDILPLLDEADLFIAASGTHDEVVLFYNSLARLAGQPAVAPLRDDLRDRALQGLAARLRSESRPGVAPARILTDLYLQPDVWTPEVISDADFAVKAATRPSPAPPTAPAVNTGINRVRIGKGIVTAVCAAPETDELFVGFDGGEVYCFRPERSEVTHVASSNLPVTSLAASADGRSLVILRGGGHRPGTLSSYASGADGSFRLLLGMPIDDLANPWITPLAQVGEEVIVGLWDGHDLYFVTTASLTARGSLTLPRPDAAPPTALILPWTADPEGEFAVLIHDGREWCLADPSGKPRHATGLVWRPSSPERNPLRSMALSWDHGLADHLELVGLGGYGTLHWATLQYEDGRLDLVALNSAAREGGYLAACLVRSRRVAGVTGSHVEWLRCGADRFTLVSTTEADLSSAVACFATRRTREILVVCEEGEVARMRIPF